MIRLILSFQKLIKRQHKRDQSHRKHDRSNINDSDSACPGSRERGLSVMATKAR